MRFSRAICRESFIVDSSLRLGSWSVSCAFRLMRERSRGRSIFALSSPCSTQERKKSLSPSCEETFLANTFSYTRDTHRYCICILVLSKVRVERRRVMYLLVYSFFISFCIRLERSRSEGAKESPRLDQDEGSQVLTRGSAVRQQPPRRRSSTLLSLSLSLLLWAAG